MNPELLRNVTPNDPNFALKLPAGYGGKFQDNIRQVPQDKWTSWRLHKVESGETLAEIARQYRVTVPAIELANHLELHATVPAGFMLNVPAAPPIVRLVHYRVRPGRYPGRNRRTVRCDRRRNEALEQYSRIKRAARIAAAHLRRRFPG